MAERGPRAPQGTSGEVPEPLLLTDDLVAVYRQLLSGRARGGGSAGDLARGDRREIVEALVEYGLVEIASDEGDADFRLRATNPVVRLAEMVAGREQALRDHEREVEQLRVLAATLVTEFEADRERRAVTVLEHLVDPGEIVARLEELYADGERELRIFVTNRQSPEGLEAARESDLSLLRRGIRVRLLCLESLVNDRAHLEYLLWYTEQGAEIRLTPTLPSRMILQDERVAVVAAHGEDPGQGAVILRGHGIVRALGALFERYWDGAAPYAGAAPARPRDVEALTPVQAEIVRMMAAGAKDDAVARRLGVSVRTVRRLTAELATRLGVESRFAFGVEAVRRGWIDGGAAAGDAPGT